MTGQLKLKYVSSFEKDYLHLVGNPKIEYFKTVYKKKHNISIDTIRFKQQELGATDWNGDSKYSMNTILNRYSKDADFLTDLFLEIEINCSSNEPSYTANHFGNALIEEASIHIGGHKVDSYDNIWKQIKHELTHNKHIVERRSDSTHGGKSTALNFISDNNVTEYDQYERANNDMPLIIGGVINNDDIPANPNNGHTKKLIYKFEFWFSKSIGQALPLFAIKNADCELRFHLTPKNKLVHGDDTVTIKSINIVGNVMHVDREIRQSLVNSDNKIEYLFDTVMNNHTKGHHKTKQDNTYYNIKQFNHSTKCLFWVLVDDSSEVIKGKGPCYFISQTENNIYGSDGNNGTLKLVIDGYSSQEALPIIYYTRIFPELYFNNIPSLDRIGVYSFSKSPFDIEPSGTVNFSKVKDASLYGSFSNNTQSIIDDKQLVIYGLHYRLLVIDPITKTAGLKHI